jgi:hypothetical protein
MQVHQVFCKAKKSLLTKKAEIVSCFIKLLLLIAFAFPFRIYAQQGGCINADTIYVNANTVPPTTNATPASFTCNGSYSYQWFMSTDNSNFNPITGATNQNLSYTQPVTSTLIFLRQAKCGSTTMYTNRVVVVPVYTACSSFGLTLTGTAGNPPATIKADTIKSNTGGIIGQYVIEWYRDTIDGSPEFVSGSAGTTDPTVTVLHPFAGEPAEGGTWHPVIKYVYINGIKYSRTYMPDARYSPDLLHCLDPIIVIVNNLNCSNGGNYFASTYGSPGSYIHKVSYTNGLNSPTLAARSFRFDLDATNKYFAWFFLGYQEADKIKITYVSPLNNTSTMLEWWEIGGTAGGTDVTTSPKKSQQVYMYKINSLTAFTFAAGDYLLIEITPSANTNTNWEFLCKCFTTGDCNIWDGTQRNIAPGSVSMVYNPTNYSYDVSYNKSATPYTDGGNSVFLKYNLRQYWAISSGYQNGFEYDNKVTLQLVNRTDGGGGATVDYYTCNLMSSQAAVTKTGSTLTVVFNSLADYNQYKNTYAGVLSNPNMSNYDPDATKLNHYKFYLIRVRIASSCGDNGTDNYYYTHYTNPPVFNDATKTMTWNFATTTNNYVATAPNDLAGQTIQAWVNACNNSVTSSNIATVNTSVRGGQGLTGIYIFQYTTNETQKTFRLYSAFASIDPNVCNLSAKGFTNQFMPTQQWEYSYFYDRVTITNAADPIHNFKLERLMDANGIFITNPANYIKVYEIVNGVVIP